MPRTCELDNQEREIWNERYDWQVEPCTLLKVVEGFDPSKCPVKGQCQKLLDSLRGSE